MSNTAAIACPTGCAGPADNLPALHSLVTGLRRALDAVTAGLTMIWSSGPVEGAVNRIKTIKRSMYGRVGIRSPAPPNPAQRLTSGPQDRQNPLIS